MFEGSNNNEGVIITEALDMILSRDKRYRDKIDLLVEKYNAKDSDCAYLAHRFADNLFIHAIDSFEDEQAARCMRIEAINLAVFLDALFSHLNRHGTRERYSCDDLTLNNKPEMLITHHYDSGGAYDTRKKFGSLYL